jgi:hypothetical protein
MASGRSRFATWIGRSGRTFLASTDVKVDAPESVSQLFDYWCAYKDRAGRGFDHVGVANTFHRVGLAPDYISLQRSSHDVPIGRVISSEPEAGTRVKHGAVVEVAFSCGPPEPGFCPG